MIGFISGKLIAVEDGTGPASVVVDTGGVGYHVLVPATLVSRIELERPLSLFIHTNLRENALELFGFEKIWEKKIFLLLLSVSGVGPRTALGIMSGLEPLDLLTAIVRADKALLSSAPGVGKKTSERLIVELETKAQKLMAELQGTVAATKRVAPPSVRRAGLEENAVQALLGLGYRELDALNAVRSAREKLGEDSSLEVVLKTSLQHMSERLR